MSWKDRAVKVESEGREPAAGKPSWKNRAMPVEVEAPKSSAGESFLRGAAQGGSLGFEDELAGLGGVLGDKLGRMGVDKVESTHPEVQAKIDALANEPEASDIYRKTRDEERAANEAASQSNPGTYFAGSLAGGIANPASRAAGTLTGALGFGAAQGLGGSNSDLTKGELKDAAIDSAIGAGAGGLGYGIGKAIPKVFDWIKAGGKRALTNLGPSAEAVEARLAGKAQDAAKSYPELAEDMAGTLKTLGKQTGELDNEAWNTLSKEANIPKITVTHSLDKAIEDLGLQGKTIGATDKQVSRALSGLKEDLGQLSDNISENDVKAIIKKLDDNINWEDQSQNKLNEVLEGIRTKFDEALKFRNPAYKRAMEPVADRTALLQELRRKFGFKNVPGEGLKPSDSSASSIQSSLRENKAVTQANLQKLKEFTGKDYSELANDYRLAQQFAKPGAQSSKRTNIGAALGTGIGGLTGGFVGAGAGASLGSLAGGAMDAYGGKVAGKIIDSYLKAGNSAAFGKFAPVIEAAAKKGPEALATVSAILETNPEFREAMKMDQFDEHPNAYRKLGSTK